MQTKYGLTSLCDPNCGVQSMNRHTDKRTERKVKAKGPKIMYIYIDICYIPAAVIIGGRIL